MEFLPLKKDMIKKIYNQFFQNFSEKISDRKYNALNIDEEISSELEKLEIIFKNGIEFLNLSDEFNLNQPSIVEAKKCLLRSYLRYNSYSFAYMVSNKIFPKKIDQYFYTLAYPMIHLVNDKSEQGAVHIDQVNRSRLHTIWTPITEYDYNALSYIKNGYYEYLIKKKVLRLNSYKQYDIKPKKFTPIVWGGYFPHIGNLNTSNNINCALVVRVTKEPLLYEPTSHLSNKIENLSFPIKDVSYDYNEFISLIDFAKNFKDELTNDDLENIKEVAQQKINLKSNKILSFSLSIIAQRMRSKPELFPEFSQISRNVLNLLSLLISSENLISLRQLLTDLKIMNFLSSNSQLIKSFNTSNWNKIVLKKNSGEHFLL